MLFRDTRESGSPNGDLTWESGCFCWKELQQHNTETCSCKNKLNKTGHYFLLYTLEGRIARACMWLHGDVRVIGSRYFSAPLSFVSSFCSQGCLMFQDGCWCSSNPISTPGQWPEEVEDERM